MKKVIFAMLMLFLTACSNEVVHEPREAIDISVAVHAEHHVLESGMVLGVDAVVDIPYLTMTTLEIYNFLEDTAEVIAEEYLILNSETDRVPIRIHYFANSEDIPVGLLRQHRYEEDGSIVFYGTFTDDDSPPLGRGFRLQPDIFLTNLPLNENIND